MDILFCHDFQLIYFEKSNHWQNWRNLRKYKSSQQTNKNEDTILRIKIIATMIIKNIASVFLVLCSWGC